jgi:serine/threonine protein kinase
MKIPMILFWTKSRMSYYPGNAGTPLCCFKPHGELLQVPNFGRYVAQKLVDNGSIGAIYECIDSQTNEVVVVKASRGFRIITNEIDAMKKLSDVPTVCQFLDSFSYTTQLGVLDDVKDCIVMKKYGMSLHDEAALNGVFSLSEIKNVAKQLFATLEKLHSIPIVHSDIKPHNILFEESRGENAKIVLIDFGSASLSEYSPECGSSSYQSPEHFDPENLSFPIDIYGAGLTLLELYVGEYVLPDDDNDDEAYLSIMRKLPEMYASRISDPVFYNFLSRLLAFNPNDRLAASQALLHPFLN